MTTIAIAGHANLGKTTLIRTMTKGSCGRIADEEGTTLEPEPVAYAVLHATFLDCPGFTRASAVLATLPAEGNSLDGIDSFYFAEKAALGAIATADVVLYVGSLETVPGATHLDELSLIKRVNPRIIGILNKGVQQSRALKTAKLAARDAAWRKALATQGVHDVFRFDAHWERYSRVLEVYAAISAMLSGEKRLIFDSRLREFAATLDNKRATCAKLAAGCVRACRTIEEVADSEASKNMSALRTKLRVSVADQSTGYLEEFANEARSIYEIGVDATEQPLRLHETEFKRKIERVAAMATHSGLGTAIGALVGAGVGALFGGPVGAILGGKIGAGIGAGGGLFTGAVVETSTHIEVRLSSQDLREIALFCLAITWCVTHQGFGNDPVVIMEDFERALQFVHNEIKTIKHPEWERCSDSTMAAWFSETLLSLDV